MGQYYLIVNVDKKQYLHPHRCGDGLKLLEFGCSSTGTMTALAILLADGGGRCGGDPCGEDPVVGSWAGDRIVIAGDDADKGRFTDGNEEVNLHGLVGESGEYEDVSRKALRAMARDPHVAAEMKKVRVRGGDRGEGQTAYDYAMAEGNWPAVSGREGEAMDEAALCAIRKDVEALEAAKARTTPAPWYQGQTQDGEYTGPGDDPPGYAGDWEPDGSVRQADVGADLDLDRGEVFARGYCNANAGNDADWAVLAHDTPIEQHCRDLLAEVDRLRALIAKATGHDA